MILSIIALLAILAILIAVYDLAKQSIVYIGTATLLVAISILLLVGGRIAT